MQQLGLAAVTKIYRYRNAQTKVGLIVQFS